MNKILLMITVFSLGYVANDILREMNVSPIGNVNAEVGGMGFWSLMRDSDFVEAVKGIVSTRCYVYTDNPLDAKPVVCPDHN